MDARILQSMLRDSNKLDLEQESNMKKLLERGIRTNESDEDEKAAAAATAAKAKEDEEEQPYSSQVIKTLADTKFWKAIKRNAGELLESVAISVTNEIEKGAKVLVGLGFFAWDRAKQDVARALPTAASIPKKKVFQIGDTSSFVEPSSPDKIEIEIEMTPSQKAKSIRQEFTTPADELSAVTAEIGKIFQRADRQVALQAQQPDKSRDTRNPFFAAFAEEQELQQQKFGAASDGTAQTAASPFYASATLSTTASRGTSRLDTAFQRTQKTKLAREKENLAAKGNRLASAAIDSAYQVKTEITSEENVPGYKTKQIRESTLDVSKRLAGAARSTVGFLGGASNFLLGVGGTKEPKQQQLPPQSGSNNNKVKADPVDFLDDEVYFAFKREEPPASSPPPLVVEEEENLSGGIVIEDNRVIDTDQPGTSNSNSGPFGFLSVFNRRGKKANDSGQDAQASIPSSAEAAASRPPEMEIITDAEFVMDNNNNSNYYNANANANDVVIQGGENGKNDKDYFTTNGYLDNMDASTAATGFVDDGLRQVTAEVIFDDDFDETLFAQAKSVDNMSVEELLEQQAEEEVANAAAEANFVTKATLRTLDVAFLVVEKGIDIAPKALELAQRAVGRAAESKLKNSAGSQVGWDFHNGNIRGDKRY